MAIVDEAVPEGTEIKLSEYLFRQFRAARYEDEESDQLPRLTKLPLLVSIGRLYYFDNAIASEPAIDGEGLFIYKSTGYVKIV